MAEAKIGRGLSEGERACVAYHCFLLERLIDDQEEPEPFITLEDDITPTVQPMSFGYTLAAMMAEFPEASVFLLHKASGSSRAKMKIKREGFSGDLLEHSPWGNQLTAYRLEGAAELTERLRLQNAAADHHWDDFSGRIVISKVPLGVHLHNTTYIGNEHRGIKRKFHA